MGFFSAIKKIFTAPEEGAPKAEELAEQGAAEAVKDEGPDKDKDKGKVEDEKAQPAQQARMEAGIEAGVQPQAEPAPEPEPEPKPAPAAEAMPASAPEPESPQAPEALTAPEASAQPAPAPLSASAEATAPDDVAAAEAATVAEVAGEGPSEAVPAEPAVAREAAPCEDVQDPAAASAQVLDPDKTPDKATEPAPKRSFFASLFGRRQAAPEPEAQAEPSPEPEAAQISAKAEQAPEPAEAPVAEQADTAAQKPAGQVAPAPDQEASSGTSAPSGTGASAGGGWALFEAAPAPEQEPVFVQEIQETLEAQKLQELSGVSAALTAAPVQGKTPPASGDANAELTVRLRQAEPKLSAWLDVVLDGVAEAGPLLESRIRFLLESLEAPAPEIDAFVADFAGWLARMEYRELDEFRSELQYRLAIALDLEDEEDERSRLFVKLTASLAKTRAEFARRLEGLFASHGELDDDFWEEMEELFIMADLGYEAAVGLVERLKARCRDEGVTSSEGVREALKREIKQIFAQPRRILKINPPEIVLMIGVNGAGKTTTIAKLAYRDRMQGKKVMIAAADTFRAAAIDQMRVWAERVGTLFHAKQPGADPASVAFEAVDRALKEGVDVLYVDTAGRLQTKVILMDELSKIRQVITKKHPGAPHRTVLVLDATTGQNALSQAKLFKESAGVDELILTKLDGTAKGGVAIAVALQQGLPITYVGLGEKVEDLRPFNGDDYADALLASV